MLAHNATLHRSVRALAHPLTIGAVILLLLNDHLFRITWPSWWTGKLGDFSWLIFFPLILAVPIALIIPSRLKRREDIVAGLSFGITGLIFAAMKTIPAAMDAGLWLLSRLTGGPFILRVDPTDLLTLPALLIGWWVWRRSASPIPASRGWAILTLGAFASIATSPPIQTGIYTLSLSDSGDIYARDLFEYRYVSSDGGLSWKLDETYQRGDNQRLFAPFRDDAWLLGDPKSPATTYRFTPRQSIQHTDDGGRTWKTDIDLSMTEAQQIYYYQTKDGSDFGPADALFDPKHGTLVVAMGHEGILTRTADHQWRWVTVAQANGYPVYARRPDLKDPGQVADLLQIQLWLAIDLPLLALGLLAFYAGGMPSAWRVLNGLVACGLWIAVLVVSPQGFGLMRVVFYVYILIFFALSGLLFGLFGLAAIARRYQPVPPEVWQTVAAAPALFLLPYLIWSQGIVITLTGAIIWSAVDTLAVVGWGIWRITRRSLASSSQSA